MVKAAGVIIRNPNKQILVLKRHINDPEGETYGLVGGKVESGETSLQAAVRETYEEIGVEFKETDLGFFKNYIWIRDDIELDFDVYIVNYSENKLKMHLQENEVTQYLWETKDKLQQREDLMIGLYEILKDINSASPLQGIEQDS